MGEVYLAEDATLRRKVALKLLPERFSEDEERVRRFQREARAASALNHPNIITIYEVGQDSRRHFIATEYIEGQTLRDLFFTAERGAGAFRDGKRMHVSDQAGVEGSFLATGFPFRAQQYVKVYVRIFEDVISIAKGVRRAGSAALDLAYTAAGIFDGFFEIHLAPWDVAAGSLLVTEAGGRVSDFSGGNRWLERGNIVGAPPAVHDELIAMIGKHVSEAELDRRATDRAIQP